MPQEGSGLLHTAEVIHWAALAIMAIVYTLRVRWLLSFRLGRERQAPGNPRQSTPEKGAMYSLANVAMPWGMESTRKSPFFYATFVLFHLGVVAGITLAFVSSLDRELVSRPPVAAVFASAMGAAFLIGCYRMVRRLALPHMRLISTPDDYFSLTTLIVWFFLGVLAQASLVGRLDGEGYLVAYLLATSFFLVYVPFSKISHYLYYPFTRYWLGRTLGHRGSMPAVRG